MKQILIYILVLFSIHCYGQQQMFLRATPAAAGNLLLDDYPGAVAAYAMTKINSSAANCVTILRASDNDTLVVGFVGNDFDNAAATTFVPSGHGYVITWWDQSGNGNHAVRSDTSLAPKLIIDGVLQTLNGTAAMSLDSNIDGVKETLVISNTISSINTDWSIFIVYSLTGVSNQWFLSTSNSVFLGADSNAPGEYFIGTWHGTPQAAAGVSIPKLKTYVLSTTFGGSTYYNGVVNNSALTWSAKTLSSVEIWGRRDRTTSNYIAGKGQAFILYPSDQSANRSAIETIINNYFSIY